MDYHQLVRLPLDQPFVVLNHQPHRRLHERALFLIRWSLSNNATHDRWQHHVVQQHCIHCLLVRCCYVEVLGIGKFVMSMYVVSRGQSRFAVDLGDRLRLSLDCRHRHFDLGHTHYWNGYSLDAHGLLLLNC